MCWHLQGFVYRGRPVTVINMIKVRIVFIVKLGKIRQPLNSSWPVVYGVRALRSAISLNVTPPKNPRLPQAAPAAFCRSVHSHSQENPLVLMNYVAFVIASGSHWQQFTVSIIPRTNFPAGNLRSVVLASYEPLLENFITTPSELMFNFGSI